MHSCQRWRCGVSVEHGTERGLERVEPGFVVPPVVECVPENRLAHLFGTRRADRTFVLVEAQASGLERQAAVLEQPAHLALGVVDHALVDHAVDAAGLLLYWITSNVLTIAQQAYLYSKHPQLKVQAEKDVVDHQRAKARGK